MGLNRQLNLEFNFDPISHLSLEGFSLEFGSIDCTSGLSCISVFKAGLPQSGKKFWKIKKNIQVREKSGNFIFSKGNLEKKS